ncbi:MAG: hypothetical protein WA734_04565 [Candidatus Acidiferrales bacterium]
MVRAPEPDFGQLGGTEEKTRDLHRAEGVAFVLADINRSRTVGSGELMGGICLICFDELVECWETTAGLVHFMQNYCGLTEPRSSYLEYPGPRWSMHMMRFKRLSSDVKILYAAARLISESKGRSVEHVVITPLHVLLAAAQDRSTELGKSLRDSGLLIHKLKAATEPKIGT